MPFYPRTFPATLFCHPRYRDYDQYPNGVADSVGYWAEARVLGGVVLCDRRDPESVEDAEVRSSLRYRFVAGRVPYTDLFAAQPDAVYIHADRSRVIYRICRLLDDQKRELTEFLLSDTVTTMPQHCPLPLLPSKANRQRIGLEQPIETTGIYRDLWERRLRPLSNGDRRLEDVVDECNYLSCEDYREAKRRAEREQTKRIFVRREAQGNQQPGGPDL